MEREQDVRRATPDKLISDGPPFLSKKPHWSGKVGTVANVPSALKNSAVETIGWLLMMRSVPKTFDGALGKRSVTKNDVWLFAASVRVTCEAIGVPELSRS